MVFAVGSAFGVAAAAESAGDFDKAKAWYQKIVDLVGDGAFKPHADVARKRIETLDSAREMPKLYARSDIPSLNKKPEAPAPLPAAPDVPAGPAIPEATPAAPAATPATTTPEPAPANPAPASPTTPPPGGLSLNQAIMPIVWVPESIAMLIPTDVSHRVELIPTQTTHDAVLASWMTRAK
jgi:hypothetical protein